jgi:hypothetical protein
MSIRTGIGMPSLVDAINYGTDRLVDVGGDVRSLTRGLQLRDMAEMLSSGSTPARRNCITRPPTDEAAIVMLNSRSFLLDLGRDLRVDSFLTWSRNRCSSLIRILRLVIV